jgi:hypothetical protein
MRLRDRVTVTVEAGLRGVAAGAMTWDVSSWDDPASTWSGIEPTFVALDGWNVERVQTRRGRDRGNKRNPAGTATVALVFDTPMGNWSFRPTSPVRVGMEMRVSARARDLAGVPIGDTIPIYRGTIRDVQDGWIADRADPAKQLFRISCQLVDRFADLAAVNLPEQPLAGAGDTTDQRLARIMELANVPTAYLSAPHAGVVTHQSSNFARGLLDEAQVAIETETGDLSVDRSGNLAFREQLGGVLAHPREDDVQLTWANDGRAGALAPLSPVRTGQNLDDVVNRFSMARAGGVAYQAPAAIDEPTDSQLRYGLRTYQRFDLTSQTDAAVEYAADYWLAQQEERTQRIDQLIANVDPYMDDELLLAVLDVELRDRHLVAWTDGAQLLEGSLHVQGVSHDIGGDSWRIGVSLWAYAGEGLRTPTARWGSARWGIDSWS